MSFVRIVTLPCKVRVIVLEYQLLQICEECLSPDREVTRIYAVSYELITRIKNRSRSIWFIYQMGGLSHVSLRDKILSHRTPSTETTRILLWTAESFTQHFLTFGEKSGLCILIIRSDRFHRFLHLKKKKILLLLLFFRWKAISSSRSFKRLKIASYTVSIPQRGGCCAVNILCSLVKEKKRIEKTDGHGWLLGWNWKKIERKEFNCMLRRLTQKKQEMLLLVLFSILLLNDQY